MVTVAVSQLRVCTLRLPHLQANYVTTPCEGCSNRGLLQLQPTNAALFSLLLEDAPSCMYPLWFHISWDSLGTRKRRKRENGDIAWHRSPLSQAWASENRDVRVKHLVMQSGNSTRARPSHLRTVDAVSKVSSKDSPCRPQRLGPSKDADSELRHSNCLTHLNKTAW